jgi:hypothetical protein
MTSINMLIVKWRKPNASEYYCPMHCEGDKVLTNRKMSGVWHAFRKGPDTKEKTAEKSCCGTKGIG